jgi:hypothetical protein
MIRFILILTITLMLAGCGGGGGGSSSSSNTTVNPPVLTGVVTLSGVEFDTDTSASLGRHSFLFETDVSHVLYGQGADSSQTLTFSFSDGVAAGVPCRKMTCTFAPGGTTRSYYLAIEKTTIEPSVYILKQTGTGSFNFTVSDTTPIRRMFHGHAGTVFTDGYCPFAERSPITSHTDTGSDVIYQGGYFDSGASSLANPGGVYDGCEMGWMANGMIANIVFTTPGSTVEHAFYSIPESNG